VKDPGGIFFAAYVGPSMNPTLQEPEVMEIMPYCNRPMHAGDVIFFLPPEGDQPVVHRVVRVTPAGISTRGDNNAGTMPFSCSPRTFKVRWLPRGVARGGGGSQAECGAG
jgi:hypothetical protein